MPDSSDPLFDAAEWFSESEASPELREEILEEWLPDEDDVNEREVYHARGVDWVGTPGDMFRIDADYLTAMPGNHFDAVKLATFAKIISSGERPLMYAPLATLSRIDADDVAESQQYADELFDAFGTTRTFTTDDEDLDAYLKDPEEYLDENAEEDTDESREALRVEMEEQKRDAVENEDGDLGQITARLRDGNHRGFASQLAEEPYVWVNVQYKEDLPDDIKEKLE